MATDEKITIAACANLAQDLVLYYYGELAEPDRRKLDTHIETCTACALYLKQLENLLPLTRKPDEPAQAFWDDYSLELRHKIAEVQEKKSWWRSLAALFQPWAVPAFATVGVVILAVTLTVGKGLWRSQNTQPDDEALMELLPVAENLEFFKTMDVLDALDVLEEMGSSSTGSA
jgi:anti-sigma factor RsiW